MKTAKQLHHFFQREIPRTSCEDDVLRLVCNALREFAPYGWKTSRYEGSVYADMFEMISGLSSELQQVLDEVHNTSMMVAFGMTAVPLFYGPKVYMEFQCFAKVGSEYYFSKRAVDFLRNREIWGSLAVSVPAAFLRCLDESREKHTRGISAGTLAAIRSHYVEYLERSFP